MTTIKTLTPDEFLALGTCRNLQKRSEKCAGQIKGTQKHGYCIIVDDLGVTALSLPAANISLPANGNANVSAVFGECSPDVVSRNPG